jgi:hypothetical protein
MVTITELLYAMVTITELLYAFPFGSVAYSDSAIYATSAPSSLYIQSQLPCWQIFGTSSLCKWLHHTISLCCPEAQAQIKSSNVAEIHVLGENTVAEIHGLGDETSSKKRKRKPVSLFFFSAPYAQSCLPFSFQDIYVSLISLSCLPCL